MTQHSSTEATQQNVSDEKLDELVLELETWIQEIGAKADEAFISCACGKCSSLTPREMLERVKNREPDGLRFAEDWFDLKESRWEQKEAE